MRRTFNPSWFQKPDLLEIFWELEDGNERWNFDVICDSCTPGNIFTLPKPNLDGQIFQQISPILTKEVFYIDQR